MEVRGEYVRIDAGVPMAAAVLRSLQEGLRGFEWGVGVPGTLGGSVRGNAGCFGSSMADVVDSVTVLDVRTEAASTLRQEDLKFDYRDSSLKRLPHLVVLDVTIRLRRGARAPGEELLRSYTEHRLRTQDIGSRSAGCVFKNVSWNRRGIDRDKLTLRFPELERFANMPAISSGFLIDRVGLKGRRIGKAMISPRHGNFFLNTGGATAEEMMMLISVAKEYVHRTFGILLEEEIQYLGF